MEKTRDVESSNEDAFLTQNHKAGAALHSPSLSEAESAQIRLCRVLCIFFMISVHVNPGPGVDSIVTSGPLSFVGTVWQDILGRASVAALSFISGYLLVAKEAFSEPLQATRKKFSSIYVPMVVWNVIFLGALLLDGLVFERGQDPTFSQGIDFGGLVNMFSGVLGPTVNLSLFFLRDLFVSSMIALLVLAHLRRSLPIVLLAVLVADVFSTLEPVVFRGSVLFFLLFGSLVASRGISLSRWSALRYTIPGALAASGVAIFANLLPFDHAILSEVANLGKRVALIFLVLYITSRLVRSPIARPLIGFERHIFLVYLSHVPLISALWVLWKPALGGAHHGFYLIFFFGAPVAAVVAGTVAGTQLERAPVAIRKAIGVGGRGRKPPAATTACGDVV